MEYMIIIILWAILSLLTVVQYGHACKQLNWKDQIIVGIIFLIGGPIFAAANVLTALLDCILPEGWDDDYGS